MKEHTRGCELQDTEFDSSGNEKSCALDQVIDSA